MTGLNIEAVVVPGDQAERVDYPDDTIWLRAVGHGEIQVADYTSTDRDGPPAHSHPWDEVQIVIDGDVEFLIDGTWQGGGSGTVQLLPRGVPHSVRVPTGTARIIQVSIGPPYDGLARDIARLFAAGAPLAQVAEVAGRHGVKLA
jgi:quercetin dioxygenase-like cupin family protein